MRFPPRAGTLLVIGLAALVVAATAWLAVGGIHSPPGAPPSIAIGGPIHLTSQSGDAFDSAMLDGKPYAVFFGFTHCPEVCPTTLYELSTDLKRLGPQATDFRVLFITVDPERDTPAFLKDYLANFDPRIVGLTGTPEEIAAVAKSFRIYYEKVPTSDGDYTMNHTAIVFLMDRKGQLFGTLGYDEGDEVKFEKLQRLLQES